MDMSGHFLLTQYWMYLSDVVWKNDSLVKQGEAFASHTPAWLSWQLIISFFTRETKEQQYSQYIYRIEALREITESLYIVGCKVKPGFPGPQS